MITEQEFDQLKDGSTVWFNQVRISEKGDRIVKVIKPREVQIECKARNQEGGFTGAIKLSDETLGNRGWIYVHLWSCWGYSIDLTATKSIQNFNDKLDKGIETLEKNLERAKRNFLKYKIK